MARLPGGLSAGPGSGPRPLAANWGDHVTNEEDNGRWLQAKPARAFPNATSRRAQTGLP